MSERELESSFLRHGAIAEFQKDEKPPYEDYLGFMKGEIDPPIDREQTEAIIRERIQKGEIRKDDFDIIICSPALRGKQTSETVKEVLGVEVPIHESEYLREIKMPMGEITPEFYERAKGVKEVREKFLKSFLNGEKVDEDMVDAYKRAQRFLTYERRVRKWTEREPLYVSHGIFSRILKVAIDHQQEDLSDDEIRSTVRRELQTKAVKFLGGMRLSSSEKGIKIIGLI